MKTILKFIAILGATVFNFANEEEKADEKADDKKTAANEEGMGGIKAPMVGNQFDFRTMVLNLLGVPPNAPTDMVNSAYSAAMNCACEDFGSKELSQHTKDVGMMDSGLKGAVNEATVRLQADLSTANTIAATVKVERDVATTALAAANEKLVKAEAFAASARQLARKIAFAALVKEGRLTKAQADNEENRLSGEVFANSEEFSNEVAKLAQRESVFGIAPGSSIFSLLNGSLEKLNADKGTTVTASNEIQKMVNAEMEAAKCDYNTAWANVKKTEKGKGLLAQMKQPGSAG